jgi:hypothetical protein
MQIVSKIPDEFYICDKPKKEPTYDILLKNLIFGGKKKYVIEVITNNCQDAWFEFIRNKIKWNSKKKILHY